MLRQMSQMVTVRPGCGARRHHDRVRRHLPSEDYGSLCDLCFVSSYTVKALTWPGNRISGTARAARKFKGRSNAIQINGGARNVRPAERDQLAPF